MEEQEEGEGGDAVRNLRVSTIERYQAEGWKGFSNLWEISWDNLHSSGLQTC